MMGHRDDPRPVREQFARTYTSGRVTPLETNLDAIRASNVGGWHPACWHRPLDEWWGTNGGPLVPLPLDERWLAYREAGRLMLRRPA